MMPADPPLNVMVEGRDYTLDPAGRWVMTAAYLLHRGRCCGSGCQNCPYPPPPPPAAARPIDAPVRHQ